MASSECVKVIVRCRPMNTREKDLECKPVIIIEESRAYCAIKNPNDEKAPPKTFTFDGAYDINSTTENIYNEIAYPLIEGVTEGYNGTIFAYGQTGCGKSFTMQGISDPSTQRGIIPRSSGFDNASAQKGIIPRAFDHIFETVSVTEGKKFLIHAAYCEIYNEEIRDLLGKDIKAKMELKEHPEKGVYVNGLSMHPVHNVHECERIMTKGWNNRSTGATLMNTDSSRSHSIFTINLEMATVDDEGEEHIRAGKLNLVDLAGSERQAKTGATGDRLKEATKINLSLSALGNVISALVDGKSKHIPYRDSKLTRLLQDSLGGNTKTLMVACLSPADNNYEESLSTLRYANRAKNIQNKPKINEDPKDALLRQYQEEIQKLKAMLMGQIPIPEGGFLDGDMGAIGLPGSAPVRARQQHSLEKERDELETEKVRLKQEYDEKLHEMQKQYEEEKVGKAKLEQDMAKLREFYDVKLRTVEGQIAHLPTTAEGEEEDEVGEDEEDQGEAGETNNKDKRKKKQKAKDTAKLATSGAAGAIAGGAVLKTVTDSTGKTVVKTEYVTKTEYVEVDRHGRQVPYDRPQSVLGGDELPAGPDLIPEVLKLQGVNNFGDGHKPEITGEEGLMAPRSSPTHAPMQEQIKFQQEEALRRLHELEQQMVGGENINNIEVKEKRTKRRKFVEEKKRKLAEANAKMDDDGIMLNIYNDIQVELKAKNKLLEKEKEKTESLERDIIDIHSEFQFERIDYLDTIRKQEKEIKLLQAFIDKIHPCLRKDSNYSSLDKIRRECKWDEDELQWVMPKLVVEKTSLPVSGTTSLPTGIMKDRSPRPMNGDVGPSIYDNEDDRYREKLMRKGDKSSEYFQAKRASQLVSSSEPISPITMSNIKKDLGINSINPLPNGYSKGGLGEEPISKGLRAAQVHGQVMNDDGMVRKPTRLDALPAVSPIGKKSRKKKNAYD
ncbi:hypothetical protein CHS0354_020727 [Potamilus streckersoni]|uniref:Kinesin-like protein n=1 Tax=Potamilus streckersoni TaxID=2493646 RepID=A0AAE0W579_9BIVA|nr:hypothetical protein CHS0354_020727 [Potamilus streckersoni]